MIETSGVMQNDVIAVAPNSRFDHAPHLHSSAAVASAEYDAARVVCAGLRVLVFVCVLFVLCLV